MTARSDIVNRRVSIATSVDAATFKSMNSRAKALGVTRGNWAEEALLWVIAGDIEVPTVATKGKLSKSFAVMVDADTARIIEGKAEAGNSTSAQYIRDILNYEMNAQPL